MIRRQLARNATAITATVAVYGLLAFASATAADPGPARTPAATGQPNTGSLSPSRAHVPARPGAAPQRPSDGMVQPAATTGPADPGEPADDPAPDADTSPAADADDDGGEADEKGPAEKPSASRPATTRREHRSGKAKAKKPADDDQEHADKRGGILGKDTVGRALDKVMPGTKDMVDKVPDWAWPFGTFLTATTAPGTSVDLEVSPPDPTTDAVTVTATMTAADGPSESTPLEVAVTVTPPAPEFPSEPATVAVEVTNMATGETVTTEHETAPEAVTVTAMVATVATVQDALNDSSETADEPSREDYAPAA